MDISQRNFPHMVDFRFLDFWIFFRFRVRVILDFSRPIANPVYYIYFNTLSRPHNHRRSIAISMSYRSLAITISEQDYIHFYFFAFYISKLVVSL